MSKKFNLVAAITFGFIPLWLFTAMLHLVDDAVGGVQGLARPGMVVSITTIAVILVLPSALPVVGFVRARKSGYATGLLLISALSVLWIALVGSTASTPLEWVKMVAGALVICTVVFGCATLPVVLVLNSRDMGSETQA